MGANASLFESIKTGDIGLFNNLGAQGMQSEDVMKMMIGVNAAQIQQKATLDQQAKAERERRLLIGAGATVGIALFALIIFLITKKIQNNA